LELTSAADPAATDADETDADTDAESWVVAEWQQDA
jgi:hypothetical protein